MKKNERNQKSVGTKVTCPKCGTEFAIADKTHITVGVVIGKDAGLGTVHPEVVGEVSRTKLPSKADERIAALKGAGVDVSGFFSIKGADDGEYVGRMVDGKMTILSDDDPIYEYIREKGDVYNPKLARRWITSQEFHMLANETNKFGCRSNSITDQIRRKGYDYMWKQMEDELYAQYKMKKNGDEVNFADRNWWFDNLTVYSMLEDYRYQLYLHVKHKVKVQKCKGVPYKRICGQDVFVDDIYKKIFEPVESLKERARKTDNPYKLYLLVREFNKIRKNRGWNPKQCAAWVDSYKGAGAFFTMQNLVRYHKCTFVDDCGKRLGKDASYAFLVAKNKEYEKEGWKMVGLLRKFLEDNNIDIKKKMEQWRKK